MPSDQASNECAPQCIHFDDCPFRDILDKDPDIIDKVYGLAQQIRYLYRTSAALAGLLNGVVETIAPGGELDGTARVSVVTITSALDLANRIKDKSAVAGQLVIFISHLAGRKRLWDQLDDRS